MVALDPVSTSDAATNRVLVRLAGPADRQMIAGLLHESGGAHRVCRTSAIDLCKLDAYVAFIGARETKVFAGMAAARVVGHELEVSAVVVRTDLDVGDSALRRLLLGEVVRWIPDGITRVRYIVANHELGAMADAQRVGLRLSAVRPGSIEQVRRRNRVLQLPRGADGIEARDELEFELLVG